MKNIGNLIGTAFTLFFLGAIVFGIFKEGHTVGIVIVICLALLIWSGVSLDDKKQKIEKQKRDTIAKAELKEKIKIDRIESMSENELISFVKCNRNDLGKHFKNGGVSSLGYGLESMSWHTSKYIIESSIDDNDFNEFIKIYRKSDNTKIFSGCWGYD